MTIVRSKLRKAWQDGMQAGLSGLAWTSQKSEHSQLTDRCKDGGGDLYKVLVSEWGT